MQLTTVFILLALSAMSIVVSAVALSKRSTYRQGKDCAVAILVDRSYLSTFAGNSDDERLQSAKPEIFDIMDTVNQKYTQTFNTGLPVVRVDIVGGEYDSPSLSSLELLEKLKGSVSAGSDPLFAAMKSDGTADSICAAFLFTYQNFQNTVGYSYTDGMCNADGANVGMVTFQYQGKKIAVEHAKKLVTHEFGHLLGATHDGQGTAADPTCSSQLFIMNPQVPESGDQSQFSQCSLNAINANLQSSDASCLIDRGQKGYMQNGDAIPII